MPIREYPPELKERAIRPCLESPARVEEALFLYVDGWYNPCRIQKKLGYRSPEEFETAWKAEQTTKHEDVPQPRQHGV